jgi:hypothetical protein
MGTSYKGWSQEKIDRYRAQQKELAQKRRNGMTKDEKLREKGLSRARKIRRRQEIRRFKEKCIEYKGGKCTKCHLIDDCCAVYDFHHRNEKDKLFNINEIKNLFGKLEITGKIKDELDKCDLVCSNCHRRIHFAQENG